MSLDPAEYAVHLHREVPREIARLDKPVREWINVAVMALHFDQFGADIPGTHRLTREWGKRWLMSAGSNFSGVTYRIIWEVGPPGEIFVWMVGPHENIYTRLARRAK